MGRYIDVKKAIERIENDCLEQVYYSKQDAIECIECVPPAEVAEAKRGKWKDKQQTVRMGDMIITGTYPTCNLCGQAEVGIAKQTNYCPNCGADMRGAE